MEPVEPVLKNIYQSNTYRKDLNWPHFDDEPRVQGKQQVKDQQSCIFVYIYLLPSDVDVYIDEIPTLRVRVTHGKSAIA